MSGEGYETHTIVRLFLLDRRARGLSPYTIRWYEQQLQHLIGFLGDASINEITPALLREFLVEFAQTHNPGGVHGVYRASKALLRWCALEYGIENPMRRVQAPRVPEEVLEPAPLATIEAMLKHCTRRGYFGDRDRAIILTLLDSGLRRNELLALDVEDVDLDSGVLRVMGKGGKWRAAFIGETTTLAILRWLRHREAGGPLWLDNRDKRLTAQGLRSVLIRRARDAGVKPPTPHMFRRAFALSALRNGADLISLQRLLGHSSLSMVQRYVKQTQDDLQQTHRKTGPVDHNLK